MSKFLLACMLVIGISGCSPSAQHNAAQASDDASIIIQNFQSAEIVAHTQGLIPDSDHVFIEQQLATIGQSGKAADACIANATNNGAVSVCITTVLNTVTQINAEGGTYLKSATAKTDFGLAMTGLEADLQSIETMIGGSK